MEPSVCGPIEIKGRIEVYVYVDKEFVYEYPVTHLPEVIKFDTTKYTDTSHIITINVKAGEGRVGTCSRRVRILN